MPDEHLGAVDHARHESVGVHSVSLRYLVVTQKTGCNSHFTQFRQQIRVGLQSITGEPAIFEDNVSADE